MGGLPERARPGVDRVPPPLPVNAWLTEGLTTEELKLLFSGEAVPVELGDMRGEGAASVVLAARASGIVPHLTQHFAGLLRCCRTVHSTRRMWRALCLTVFQSNHDGWITRPCASRQVYERSGFGVLLACSLCASRHRRNAGDFNSLGSRLVPWADVSES
jgi:hypothetical protein